ncbi:MAG TPA: SOS response-associated peptidase [Salinivirgaceae bacterium]|nr:SOS response-associated peptidase [Salinivirgaceae bacterium]
MCGRYVLASKLEIIERRFGVSSSPDFKWTANYNIAPGTYAPVISSDQPNTLQLFRFGLTPFWAEKPTMIINARAEGDRNQNNAPEYRGARDIINKPAFRKPIRSQRCLIPADAFIEGTTQHGLDEPFLVFLKFKMRPFAFAGIWDQWLNQKTGELIRSFAIITTPANKVLQAIPHHRTPLILQPIQEKLWLNPNTPLSKITEMLEPPPAEIMNAYRISQDIKSPKNNSLELLQPKSRPLFQESETEAIQIRKRYGFGRTE